jgi:hypothetical protein
MKKSIILTPVLSILAMMLVSARANETTTTTTRQTTVTAPQTTTQQRIRPEAAMSRERAQTTHSKRTRFAVFLCFLRADRL